ncbi:MAG: transporter suffix domain-containing protein [Paludibacteraceae bacterium]|nr:transporter suffix domain-containing protein [Paludibacteraceae bacterium]
MKGRIQEFLQRFSFRTGVIIMALSLPLYIVAFAQAFLSIPTTTKTILFFVFYLLAKLLKYMGLAIVGVEGWERIKRRWKKNIR